MSGLQEGHVSNNAADKSVSGERTGSSCSQVTEKEATMINEYLKRGSHLDDQRFDFPNTSSPHVTDLPQVEYSLSQAPLSLVEFKLKTTGYPPSQLNMVPGSYNGDAPPGGGLPRRQPDGHLRTGSEAGGTHCSLLAVPSFSVRFFKDFQRFCPMLPDLVLQLDSGERINVHRILFYCSSAFCRQRLRCPSSASMLGSATGGRAGTESSTGCGNYQTTEANLSGSSSVIRVPRVDYESLRAVVDFIYSGGFIDRVTSDRLSRIKFAALVIGIDELAAVCDSLIKTHARATVGPAQVKNTARMDQPAHVRPTDMANRSLVTSSATLPNSWPDDNGSTAPRGYPYMEQSAHNVSQQSSILFGSPSSQQPHNTIRRGKKRRGVSSNQMFQAWTNQNNEQRLPSVASVLGWTSGPVTPIIVDNPEIKEEKSDLCVSSSNTVTDKWNCCKTPRPREQNYSFPDNPHRISMDQQHATASAHESSAMPNELQSMLKKRPRKMSGGSTSRQNHRLSSRFVRISPPGGTSTSSSSPSMADPHAANIPTMTHSMAPHHKFLGYSSDGVSLPMPSHNIKFIAYCKEDLIMSEKYIYQSSLHCCDSLMGTYTLIRCSIDRSDSLASSVQTSPLAAVSHQSGRSTDHPSSMAHNSPGLLPHCENPDSQQRRRPSLLLFSMAHTSDTPNGDMTNEDQDCSFSPGSCGMDAWSQSIHAWNNNNNNNKVSMTFVSPVQLRFNSDDGVIRFALVCDLDFSDRTSLVQCCYKLLSGFLHNIHNMERNCKLKLSLSSLCCLKKSSGFKSSFRRDKLASTSECYKALAEYSRKSDTGELPLVLLTCSGSVKLD